MGDYKFKTMRSFPTRPIKLDRVVRVGSTVVGVSSRGTIYTTSSYKEIRPWTRLPGDLCDCLLQLGLVPKEAIEQRKAAQERKHRLCSAKHAIEYTAPGLAKLGVKLTKSQMAKLSRVVKSGGQ